jgi:MutS domain V
MSRLRFNAECRWRGLIETAIENAIGEKGGDAIASGTSFISKAKMEMEKEKGKNAGCLDSNDRDLFAFTLADVHVKGPFANVHDDLYRDTEVFTCFDESDSNTLMSMIVPHLSLKGSTVFMSKLLRSPCSSAAGLEERVAYIRRMDCQAKIVDWSSHMDVIREHEADLVWLLSESHVDKGNDYNDDQYAVLFFQMWPLKHLNGNRRVIEMYAAYRCICIPLMGLLSPFIYIVTTYLVLRIGYGFEIDFNVFLSIYMQSTRMLSPNTFSVMNCVMGALYVTTIYSSCETAVTVYTAYSKLRNRISNASKALEACRCIARDFEGTPDIKSDDGIFFIPSFDKNVIVDHKLTLSSYRSCAKGLRDTLYWAYAIDVTLSISRFKEAQHMCHPRFRTTGSCGLRGFWHPCISSPVKNDLSFGPRKNVLLTGPNAAGKSSCLKAVSLLVLMSQTLTVACASRAHLTPFHVIHSHIHVPDCKGKESLFEAEMARCLRYVAAIEGRDSLQDGQFAFCVVDEIFNSTNPIEGQSAAFAACTNIGNNARSVGIISTHYDHLTTLGKNRGFVNHKMAAIVSKDGSISYPFQLRPGVARQYLVFEIMKAKGFDSSIIDAAIECKRKLLGRC